ncbi:MAG: conjugative relaxase [Deltaproteobacteria bacterium]|nr:conjugative relaxase [Deltaproteobacteria bacterium]
MLSMKNVGVSQDVGHYYENSDDYYTKDQTPSGWQGNAAEILGLQGEVQAQDFEPLLAGILPNGETLQVAAAGRRGGTDLTFSAPKSVSMHAMIAGETKLIEAHDRAVAKTLKYAETIVAYRKTKDGKTERAFSNNLIAATFRHDLSRACDPQLHTHAVVLNLTQREDGKWRAMDNELLYRQKMLMGAMYRSELAKELQFFGYQIRTTSADGCFELAHISDGQIEAFSQRSQMIEEALQKNGLTRETATALEKQVVTIATRKKKTNVDRQMLQSYWQESSEKAKVNYQDADEKVSKLAKLRFNPRLNHLPAAVRVNFAIKHLTERQSVITEVQVIKEALQTGIGKTTFEAIKMEIERRLERKTLIRSKSAGPNKDFRFTTPEAIKRERMILDIEKRGRGYSQAPFRVKDIHQHLNSSLNEGQKQACELILTSKNQIVGVQGLAGTGKTFMLRNACEFAKTQGFKMIGVAPSASAAQELAKTGMPAQTITSFQVTQNKNLSPKSILVIDEAGMASANQIESLLKSAKQYGTRVVLIGDTQQLKAVEAGRPFAQLQDHGMQTAGMSEIQRQKNPELKNAVELAAREQIVQSIALLNKKIVEVPDHEARYDRIARDYVSIAKKDRKNTLVVSGTNDARKEINKRIRKCLGFKEKGQEINVLARKDFTKAQLRRTETYQVGDYIKPERDYRKIGLNKNELYQVVEINNKSIRLEKVDGCRIVWTPSERAKVNVYSLEKCEMAKGEMLRVTQNNRENGLINGEKLTFLKPEKGNLHFKRENGDQVTLSTQKPLHLEHGYCSTVHSAQGKTCERVLVEANTRSLTSAQDNFYVAISRARQEAKIYTNDRAKLPETMSRKNEKEVALDLNQSKVSKKQKSHQQDRDMLT